MRDHLSNLSSELSAEIRKVEPKLLFFGTISILLRFLEIQPNSINAGLVTIEIQHYSVFYGAVSLVFLHYFFTAVFLGWQGEFLSPFSLERMIVRRVISRKQVPYYD